MIKKQRKNNVSTLFKYFVIIKKFKFKRENNANNHIYR